ncbi:MAG: cellulase family glycosylhydrolase [Alphaproteobacteria bacterium]
MRAAVRNILVSLLAVLLPACLAATTAHGQSDQPAFRRGIGISHIMAWAPLEPAPSKNFVFPPFTYPDATFARELKALRRTGFDFVRFAVDPGPFLQWQGERRDDLMQKLLGYVRLILSHDLSVIVDFHPSDMHPDYLGARIAAGPDAPLFKDYLRVLARTAASLNELQSSRVALEIMNEPPMRAPLWRPMRDAAYAAVRKAAPKLTLVLDGGEEGNLEGTIALDTYRDDPNILFSFHYYRPWQFTHQGMAGMAAQHLTDVPYPAHARPMRESIEATTAAIAAAKITPSELLQVKTKARQDLESYRASSFDRSHIARDFDKVARWARERSVPAHRVVLGEFGVMESAQRQGAARQADRLRWLSDVREEAETHGFVWAAWVHSGSIGFSLVERDGSTELDPGVLRALGFGSPRVMSPAAPVR